MSGPLSGLRNTCGVATRTSLTVRERRALATTISCRSLPVMSGFCSEPERSNSFSITFWVSTNHE